MYWAGRLAGKQEEIICSREVRVYTTLSHQQDMHAHIWLMQEWREAWTKLNKHFSFFNYLNMWRGENGEEGDLERRGIHTVSVTAL